ncbi:hypothetical protein BAS09_01990 [Elizabethkingia ursingii]|uniref:restriction endonuclease subunit S n=1 Tax=Elizabethkingia ursingii TaxID=1756150 RepID=UPI00099A81AD|nr:restriction endonuclease subunit S [Elizabethkingia ursingii]OPC06377.1 hypothetical protein BAS09_01990 [Elizabethkingia ursingii]
MMEGWKEVTIGDLGTVVTGNTPPRKNPELYGSHTLFVKPTDISEDSKYTYNPEECYSDLGYKKYTKSLIPKGSTCVVTIGSIGKKMTKAHCDLFINQAVNAVIPNEEYNEEFVYYVLKYNLSQLKTFDSGTASGRENVSKSSFSNIKIKVQTDFNKQKRIGEILSCYDDLIENNQKRIKILEEMAQQTYEEWFVRMRFPGYETAVFDENGLPEGWERKISSELFKITIGKTPPRGENIWFNSIDIENRMKWMSISDIRKSNVFIYDTKENLTKEAINKFNFNILKKGNIALSFKLTVGLVIIAAEDMTTNEAIAHFNQGKICNSYTYFYLKNFDYNSLGSTSSIGTAINSKIVKIIPFLIPKTEILNDFDLKVQPLLDTINNINQQNLRLREARDILLPRLMTGMIDIPESLVQVKSVEAKPIDAKVIPLLQPKKEASKEFKEAVLIACLTERFGSEKYPLGRKRYTKLSYLFHRYSDNKIQDYLRKAAGPYNPKTKYGGPEKIALNSKYIQNWKGDKGTTGFVVAEKIEDAKKYFSNYWQIADLDWLVTEFKFKSNDELELLATVDNSLIELSKKNIEFTSTNVLDIIKSEKEWEAKLERTIFSDANVERSIRFLTETLQYEK